MAIIMFVVTLTGGWWSLQTSVERVSKQQQLQDLKMNELTNKVLDALRSSK